MARVAAHHLLSFEVLLVDGDHHRHHLPGSLFLVLIVLIECALDVAEIAFHAQRVGDELHGRNQLVGWNVFEHLDVLERLDRGLRPVALRSLRRLRCNQDGTSGEDSRCKGEAARTRAGR